MTINLQKPDIRELKPKITVFGVGGGGGNAVNNMINGGLDGVEFVVANTDAQALAMSKAERVIQLGVDVTEGLGAGSQPNVGAAAAEECLSEIQDHLAGTHMCFVTAGMGGGTGTGAAPVVARAARELGILTVGVVTKPFQFEGGRRMKTADAGILELQKNVDTLIVIPNQNLFRIANDKTTFADAFGMADQVLYSGVACITDLMVKEGLINLDFADVRSVMREMGKAMMGTGESSGEGRAMQAAEAAISNPLLDETSMRGAQGLLISITGGRDMTLFEVDEAATRIREEIDAEANIIVGATFDESLDGIFRVSVVATGIDNSARAIEPLPLPIRNEAGVRPSMLASATARPQANNVMPQSQPAPVRVSQIAAALDISKPNTASITSGTVANGVHLSPLKRTPSVSSAEIEDDFKAALEEELMPSASAYIPPAAERPQQVTSNAQASKIPAFEDFPAIARASVQPVNTHTVVPSAGTAPVAQPAQREGSPMSLLQKLKNGFGAREHHGETAARVEPQSAPQASYQPTPQAAAPHAVPQPNSNGSAFQRMDDSPYAPRRTGLDAMGRPVATPKPMSDEDQLDIPAFLRRQAN